MSCYMRRGGWQTARDRARLTHAICDDAGWAYLRFHDRSVACTGMLCDQSTASRNKGAR